MEEKIAELEARVKKLELWVKTLEIGCRQMLGSGPFAESGERAERGKRYMTEVDRLMSLGITFPEAVEYVVARASMP